VIVPGNLLETEQIDYFGLALDRIERTGDLINKLLEVHAGGLVSIADWPPR
jgi:hypothetical protein